jgi:hypothetical protein
METVLAANGPTSGLGSTKQRPDYFVFLTRSLLLLGGMFFFLAARSTVWAQQVSLDNFDLLLAATFPFATFSAFRRLSEASASVRIQSIDEQCLFWGWTLSLFSYVLLHSIHWFEQIEGPIREYFAPGAIRYGLYAIIYTAISYIIVIAIRLLITRSFLTRRQALVLAAGMLLNATYLCFSVFIVRF